MRLIDSHAHLDAPEFDLDRKSLFESMKKAGIETAIIPGVSPAHWHKQLETAKAYGCPYGLGIHPWFCEQDISLGLNQLESVLDKHKNESGLVAIGECGLDKLRMKNREAQYVALNAQLVLAKEYDLPVILHVVKAHNEMIELLKQHALPKKGVIHGFYGSIETANEYIKLGYKLGIGGLILNQNTKKLQKCVAQLPLDSFVIETDSPAMAPHNSAETRNTPLILQSIITEIANLQKKSSVLISEHAFRNVAQLFDLKLNLI